MESVALDRRQVMDLVFYGTDDPEFPCHRPLDSSFPSNWEFHSRFIRLAISSMTTRLKGVRLG